MRPAECGSNELHGPHTTGNRVWCEGYSPATERLMNPGKADIIAAMVMAVCSAIVMGVLVIGMIAGALAYFKVI
jgi:hypothetical protein